MVVLIAVPPSATGGYPLRSFPLLVHLYSHCLTLAYVVALADLSF